MLKKALAMGLNVKALLNSVSIKVAEKVMNYIIKDIKDKLMSENDKVCIEQVVDYGK